MRHSMVIALSFEPIEPKSTAIHRLTDDWLVLQDETFRLETMLTKLKAKIDVSNAKKRDVLLNDGIPAEILQEGGKWTRGSIKIKILVEFCPEVIETLPEAENASILDLDGSDEQEISNWPPAPIN